MKILFIGLNSPSHYAIWNYLSTDALIGHIEGVFKTEDVKCDILYCNNINNIKHVIKEINKDKYDIIGFSVLTNTFDLLKEILSKISLVKAEILFGNQLATYSPEHLIYLAIENKNINYKKVFCVLGEGEETITQIINLKINNNNIYSKIETVYNICYYDGYKFHVTELKSPELNTLKYPPKYNVQKIKKNKYIDKISKNWVEYKYEKLEKLKKTINNSIQMQLSRGCFWGNCSYCTRSSFRHGKNWESFSIERIEEDLRNVILNLNYRVIEFSDDEFFGGREKEHLERIDKIINIIQNINNEINAKISFRIFTRPDVIFKQNEPETNIKIRKILVNLKKLGLDRIYIGIESGSCEQLNRYNRGLTHDIILKTISIFNELNIEFDCGFMLFDPLITLDELIENVNFFLENNLIRSNQWFWRPVVINKGSIWGDDSFGTFNKGKYDPDTMSYEYEIKDKDVRFISDFISNKTKETRKKLYAIKQISKSDFDYNKNEMTKMAKETVETYGILIVELIKDLALVLKKNNEKIENVTSKFSK